MPTEQELLAATVKATAELFKSTSQLDKLKKQLQLAEQRERAIASKRTVGETEPEDETTPLV